MASSEEDMRAAGNISEVVLWCATAACASNPLAPHSAGITNAQHLDLANCRLQIGTLCSSGHFRTCVLYAALAENIGEGGSFKRPI